MLAYSYVHSGRNQEAIAVANRAIALEGRRALMLAIKARAFEQLGRLPEAVGAWRAATSSKGGGLWLYQAMLARALARSGDFKGASAAAARAAAGADPSNATIVTALQTAIQKRCYGATLATDSCADPLAGWGLSPERRPDTAQNSQNATGRTS